MKNKERSFTLVELMVVISIIGLLSSIIFVSLSNARGKAKIATSLSFSSQIQNLIGIESVGEWSFNNNLNDTFSGFNNNGTWMGGGSPSYVASADGKLGQAISFDGNHYVQIPPSSSLVPPTDHAFTAEAWIKMDAYAPSGGNNMSVVIYRQGHFALIVSNGGFLGARFWSNGTGVTKYHWGSRIQLGKWYHVAVSFIPPDILKFYLNGTESTSVSGVLFNVPFSPGYYPDLYIGKACSDFWCYNFVGTIDNVRVYYESMPLE